MRARKVDKAYGVLYGENEYGEHGVGYGETIRGHYVGEQNTVTMNAI